MSNLQELTMFARSFILLKAVRVKTAGGAAEFWNPLTASSMRNTDGNKWLTIPAGTVAHLVSLTETPDQATVLLAVPPAKDGEEAGFKGVILRKRSWEALLDGQNEPKNDDTAPETMNLENAPPVVEEASTEQALEEPVVEASDSTDQG